MALISLEVSRTFYESRRMYTTVFVARSITIDPERWPHCVVIISRVVVYYAWFSHGFWVLSHIIVILGLNLMKRYTIQLKPVVLVQGAITMLTCNLWAQRVSSIARSRDRHLLQNTLHSTLLVKVDYSLVVYVIIAHWRRPRRTTTTTRSSEWHIHFWGLSTL